jgi:hypothetical protein
MSSIDDLKNKLDAVAAEGIDDLPTPQSLAYGRGSAFYKLGGVVECPRPNLDYCLEHWGLGFLAALADDCCAWDGAPQTIEDALEQTGIRGVLQVLVIAAMRKGVAESDSFVRLPPFEI